MYDADFYHENNCIQQKIAVDCLEKHGSKITWKDSKNSVIDVGCGEGTVTTSLKKLFPRITTIYGCDINEDMVRLAIQHYSDKHTKFGVLDIAGDIPDELMGRFTHLFSFFALNWVPDQISSFNNIHKLLEEDGECFLAIVTSTPLYEVYRHFTQSDKWKPWVYDVERHISYYHDSLDPVHDITNMMKTIGFADIDIVYEEVYNIFPNIESFKGTLQAINPFIIPPEQTDDFWNEYLELWSKYDGIDNIADKPLLTHIKYKFKLVTVHARKQDQERLYPATTQWLKYKETSANRTKLI